MKIAPINMLAMQKRNAIQKHSCPIFQDISNNREYNPVYYRPLISFKGKEFDSYFPSEILGISEEKFDAILKEIVESEQKRKLLAEYIISQASKNSKAMDFVGMWKRQIPSIMNQGMFSISGNNGHNAINKILNITAKNSSSSALQRFNDSDYQTEILLREGKSTIGGLIAYKLSVLASLCPDITSKSALYAASFAVGYGSYKMSSEDSKKIQNKQFIKATKELIKHGAIDPYSFINKIDNKILNLKPEDENKYANWKDDRLKEIRFTNTGYKKDTHNDFATEEARNVLKIVVDTLKHNAGFDDEKIAAFLSLMSVEYASVGETREAQYLLELTAKIQEALPSKFDNDIFQENKSELYDTYITLTSIQKENEEYTKAIETLNKARRISEAAYGIDSTEFLETHLKKLDYIQEQRLYLDKMLPYIKADENLSISDARKKSLSDALSKIYDDSFFDKKNSYFKKEAEKTIKTILGLMQKNNVNNKYSSELLNILSKRPDMELYKHLECHKDIPESHFDSYDTPMPLSYYAFVADDLTEYIKGGEKLFLINNKKLHQTLHNNLPSLVSNTEEQKISGNNNIKDIFVIDSILEKSFDETKNYVIKNYGTNSIEKAELFKLQYQKEKFADKNSRFNYNNEDVPYLQNLLERFYILRDNYGMSDERTMDSLADYAIETKDSYEIFGQVLPLFKKEASQKLKDEYLPKIYQNYAENWINEKRHSSINNLYITNYALEGIIAYKKAIDNAQKPDALLIYGFLSYLDDLYSHEILQGADCFDYKMPFLNEINQLPHKQAESEYRKYNVFSSWSSFAEDELNQLVKITPGPFNINERKLLEMKKKHENVFFQKKYNEKIDNQLKLIENSIGVFEIK